MTDSDPQAILLRLGKGVALPPPPPPPPQDPQPPQLMFFPISGATAPLKGH